MCVKSRKRSRGHDRERRSIKREVLGERQSHGRGTGSATGRQEGWEKAVRDGD